MYFQLDVESQTIELTGAVSTVVLTEAGKGNG